MSEVAEVSAAMIDGKMTAILNKYPEMIDAIHFSDQYTGPKPTDDQVIWILNDSFASTVHYVTCVTGGD